MANYRKPKPKLAGEPIDKKFNFISRNRILSRDQMYRTLDENGNLLNEKYKAKLNEADLKKAYDFLILSRQQDTYMSQLQRQGRMLTFAPNFGEEACQVAVGMAMQKKDWFIPAFRANATMLIKGVKLIDQMLYWNGQETGSQYGKDVNCLPVNIPIGTQYSHAVGVALKLQYKKEPQVAVTFIGDGGTSEGEFYEAMNFAAVHKLPTVFCINNNQWAISTPTGLESVCETLSQKGIAVGIPSVRIDGNDLLASYDVVKQAIDYVREGNGPILVEFVTWRQGVHTSSDNPSIYRTKEEEKAAEIWEPIHRIEKYLETRKIYTKKDFERIKAEKLELVKKTYSESLKLISTKLDDIFDYTYEKLPEELAEQKAEAKKFWTKEKITWTKDEVL